MPPQRKPLAVLEMNGSLKKNPKRYADRVPEEPGKPLGPPPEAFTLELKSIWKELAHTAPKGVLHRSDRIAVEMACMVINRMRTTKIVASEFTLLRTLLASLGMTPADRAKIAPAPDGKDK
jgi:hypothetical protein